MGFLMYDIIFLVIFTAFVVWFLYTRRKNLEREGILFLYRTKFGIKAIKWFSNKFKKQLKWIQYISIAIGYILMVFMVYLFVQLVYIYIKNPDIVKAVKVPPVMPLIPYLPSLFNLDFLPNFYFTHWILILAVVAIFHEFAHGIFANFHKIKIKSTGFGFLGPFLAAFVEPDEKLMVKKPIKAQLSVLSAGTFANVIISVIFAIVFLLFVITMYVPAGATFDIYVYSTVNLSQASSINGINVNHPNPETILKNLDITNSKNLTKIEINNKSYFIDNNKFIKNINQVKEIVIVYDNLPAIASGMPINSVITGVNDVKITSTEDLANEIKKYNPGESAIIWIKTPDNQIKNFNITFADNGRGYPYLGIGLYQTSTNGIRGKVYLILNLVRTPGTYYESRFNSDFIKFIYDLLWWMILINISVALINMLPLGIFDGGRVFYLTILTFTKSEIKAKIAFKLVTWILLILLALMMVFWVWSL